MNPIKQKIMISVGFVSILIGVLGIFIPLLPTTPFLLLSGFLFSKSSSKFHYWLLNHKYLGKYLKNYSEKKGIPIKAKLFTILLLWITITTSTILFIEVIWVKLLLLIIAIAVTVHLIVIPVYKKKK